MTDPFLKASQTYINAAKTCQRSGPALEVSSSKDTLIPYAVGLGALVVVVLIGGIFG